MSAAPDASSEHLLLKIWEDYTANCRTLIEQMNWGQAGMSGAGQSPFSSAWQQFAQSIGMSAHAPIGAFQGSELLTKFAPAFGATRDYQQIAQRMAELAARFQRAAAELAQFDAEVRQQALHAVQTRSAPGTQDSQDAASMYDAWIDGAEEAYAHIAHGEKFARLFGELCNIFSSFKIERGKLLEALARHLDLPSRAEVDSLHRQIRDLTLALRRVSPTETKAPRKRQARKKSGS